jgi:hypothetical protein
MLRKKSGICITPSVLYNKKKNQHKTDVNVHDCKRTDYWVWYLTPLSTNSSADQFYWWSKMESTEKNHGPATSHWQTLSHNVVSPELDSNS